jgi:serine/threonine protein kinase/Tfp pilus assembly protein PilF
MTTTSAKAAADKKAQLSEQEQAEHDRLMDEAYDLFCSFQQAGTKIDPKEFAARFPQIQNSVTRMIQVHGYFTGHDELIKVPSQASRPRPSEVRELVNWPKPGDKFAGFELLRELGRGAFACVYEAIEPAVGGRHVALKITPFLGHSATEAAALGRLSHPNVVDIYSVPREQASGFTAVCMPYHGDVTLADVVTDIYGKANNRPDGKRPPRAKLKAAALFSRLQEAAGVPPVLPDVARAGDFVDGVRWLAVQLADALAYMHARGICHRDLKPSNILVRPDGAPVLVDFNLAADVHDAHDHPAGTPIYMAPERLRAFLCAPAPLADKSPARSDLYALGLILYELLTGKHPFGPPPFEPFERFPLKPEEEERVRELLARQERGCAPIRELRPEVDRDLAQVVEQCLACKPNQRPPSAAAVAQALRRSQEPRARLRRWLSRHRKLVAAACLFVVAGGSFGAVHVITRPPGHVVDAELGIEAAQKGDATLAISRFTNSLRADPNQSEVLFARGRAYLKLAEKDPTKYSLAAADFEQAQGLAREASLKGKYKAFLAYCFQKRLEQRTALKVYEEALDHGFQTAEVYNNLARIHMDWGDKAKAEDYLNRALEINPNLQVAHFNLAVLCLETAIKAREAPDAQARLLDEGIKHLQSASQLGVMTGDMLLIGARIYARASSIDERWTESALTCLAAAIERGIHPRQFAAEKSFARLKARSDFLALTRQTPPAGQPPTERIEVVEPASD